MTNRLHTSARSLLFHLCHSAEEVLVYVSIYVLNVHVRAPFEFGLFFLSLLGAFSGLSNIYLTLSHFFHSVLFFLIKSVTFHHMVYDDHIPWIRLRSTLLLCAMC